MQKQATLVGKATGFTLIEMLVVIAIGGALTAVLLPVFAKTRDRARMSVCTSNLHQVALALNLYANDYDGEYPPNNTYELQERRRLAWELLMPYTHDHHIFHCPDETGAISRTLGYDYRVGIWNDPTLPLQKPPRPGSGTVVAVCDQHTKRNGEEGWVTDASGHEIGPLIVVREDGSVSRVMADQVEEWAYGSGQWYQLGGIGPCPVGATICMTRFPGEEWPPQL